MWFWCRKCRSRVGVSAPVWRVSTIGMPNVGGSCENCGDEVLRRISKVSDAPPDIGAQALAVRNTYQHWRKVRTEERDKQLRTPAVMFARDRQVVDKLAAAFGLRPQYVRLILRNR